MMHDPVTGFTMGELFCGAGGLGLGAQIASEIAGVPIDVLWATDRDESACSSYRDNINVKNRPNVVCDDIANIKIENLPPVDGITFGFPCNDFSIIGEKKGTDGEYGGLYGYGVRAISKLRPKWFLAENVGGLTSSKGGEDLRKILKELSGAGYNITPHLYKFEEYGVPQARHRVIIVGIRNDISVTFRVPSPDPYAGIDVTAKTAIQDPPIPDGASNHEVLRPSDRVRERLSYINPGENAFTADMPDHLRLNCGSVTISVIYKKLDPSKPAYTVTGSGGGGTHMYHWAENRALTNRERARLQTFPDTFTFSGTKSQVRKQIGMAVPPRGAAVIFKAIFDSFNGIEYPSIPQNMNF